MSTSPFQKAKTADKRLKLFLWGDSGVGKTTLALQFPSPAVIDMEGGTSLYGDKFDFDVLPATTADEAMKAVNWLLANEHNYKTLVIDPISVYWDALQKKWSDIFLKRNTKSRGYKYEFYNFQAKDWNTIKGEFKNFIRKVTILDMNVVAIARQKPLYAEGDFMKIIGDTFDCEKNTPCLFDIVIKLYKDKKGTHKGETIKDRSNKLPQDFESSINLFEDIFGKTSITRKAKPTKEPIEIEESENTESNKAQKAKEMFVDTAQETVQEKKSTVDIAVKTMNGTVIKEESLVKSKYDQLKDIWFDIGKKRFEDLIKALKIKMDDIDRNMPEEDMQKIIDAYKRTK